MTQTPTIPAAECNAEFAGARQRFPNPKSPHSGLSTQDSALRPPRTLAILQSNYIPWKGYFDLIRRSDLFILYDDMQFTRRDWRNRNVIKTPQGLHWLTIPVQVKGRYFQPIREVQISDPAWTRTHWQTLTHNYARAPFWHHYREQLESLYLGCRETSLSRINHRFLTALCDLLDIHTPIHWSMDYNLAPGKSERLLDLCRQIGASRYLSGPAARDYLDESLFDAAGVCVEWMDYSGYPEYPQQYGPFEHHVSVLDLLLNVGPDAPRYLQRSAPSPIEAL